MSKDIVGLRFGRLVVLSKAGSNKFYHPLVLVKCDCGREKIVTAYSLTKGATKSCGCLSAQKIGDRSRVHGMTSTPVYVLWQHMKNRCFRVSDRAYKDYGGRGITVCSEWEIDFMAFYSWAMDNGYEKGLEIDRRDNNGNYCPENCRFVTRKINANNKRSNVVISFNGETHNMVEWSAKLSIPYDTLRYRMKKGWPLEKALTA